ncbi:MAG TPA: hypothetical protein VNR00_18690 [Opitutus sp.]|nr:hypothetical protein [Opitutus sp.]
MLAFVTWSAPQGLHFFDPVLPLRALTQWQQGLSPNWNTLLRVDPANLLQDRAEWLGWWAPGTSLLLLPAAVMNLPLGVALRLIALTAIAVGSVGWTRWFAREPLPRTWLVALAVSIPWMHYASANLFRYSAEALAFAAAPWSFLALTSLAERSPPRPFRLGCLGLALGFTYWLKFSLFLAVLAAAGGWAVWSGWRAARRENAAFRRWQPLWFFGGFATAPLAWTVIDQAYGGTTPLAAPRAIAWSSTHLVSAVANPALAAADAFSPLFFLRVHPGFGRWGGGSLEDVAWLGVPGGVLLIALLVRAWQRRMESAGLTITMAALGGTTAALLVLWVVADVDRVPRHIAQCSIAALPFALTEARNWWQTSSNRRLRTVLAAAGLAYVAIPFLSGFAYVLAKTVRDRGAALSSQKLAVWSIDAESTIPRRLQQLYQQDPAAILVVPDPEVSLLWPGRSIWSFAGGSIGEDLQHSYRGETQAVWRSSGPIRLHVLTAAGAELPPPLATASFEIDSIWPSPDGRYELAGGVFQTLHE